MKRFSTTEVAGFFATGAALGAITGLLLAPKSGEKTRKEIRKLSRRTIEQLDDLQSDIREQVGDACSQVKKLIKTA